jgi:tetratricopeptide (TPR) repeat protein
LEELGIADRPDLAQRAAAHLGAAGVSAAARGEARAASRLLDRATRLPGDELTELGLLLEHATVLVRSGDGQGAERRLRRLEERAAVLGEHRILALTSVEREYAKLRFGRFDPDHGVRTCMDAAKTLERLGDSRGQARALARALAQLVAAHRYAEAVVVGRRALALARAAEAGGEESEIVEWLLLALVDGPTPFGEIERFVRLELDRIESPALEWLRLLTLGIARGARGDADGARMSIGRAKAVTEELGLHVNAAATSMQLVLAERLAGDVHAAGEELRAACARLEAMDAVGPLASVTAYLGLVACEASELAAAERHVTRAEEVAAPEDVEVHVLVGAVRARLALARGDHVQAESTALAATALADSSPFDIRALSLETLADVLAAAGRHEEARSLLEQALRLYEGKECTVAAARLRDELARL